MATGKARLAPVPPGRILKQEFMVELGLSANALAGALGVPTNRITGILNGTRVVTADTALRLARYFGTSEQFWLNLQTLHDLELARRERAAEIRRTVKPRAATAG